METIKFHKMHGLGNDFIVIDGTAAPIDINQLSIPTLANRHIGIGFDQLLLIESSEVADFSCRIFNSDGSEAEQCGNGMRCVARYICEAKLKAQDHLTLETASGIVAVDIFDFDNIKVTMGVPEFQPSLEIKIHDQLIQLVNLSIGNPHAILHVESVANFPTSKFGQLISIHSAFPNGTNVGFLEVVTREHIRLRTFERGVGETFACGSNSCAAVVAGISNQLLDQKVKVELALGNLWVEWAGGQNPVILTGPSARVFSGEITQDS